MASDGGLENLERDPVLVGEAPPAGGRSAATEGGASGIGWEVIQADPRVQWLPPPEESVSLRRIWPEQRTERDRERVQWIEADGGEVARGRMEWIEPAPDPRVRELRWEAPPAVRSMDGGLAPGESLPLWGPGPGLELVEVNVRSYGAIGTPLHFIGSMQKNDTVVRLRRPLGMPGEDGPPGGGGRPRVDPFDQWRVGARIAVRDAVVVGWPLRAVVKSIDRAGYALSLSVPAERTVTEVDVWNDDGTAIQRALDSQLLGPKVVRVPAGRYAVGVPHAEDNQPLRISSDTTLLGEGVGETVLVLADEVNQRLDRGLLGKPQDVHATLLMNAGSGLFVFGAVRNGRATLPPPDKNIRVAGLALDGNQEHQRELFTPGGRAEVWREAPGQADAGLAPWVDVRKLVRWGSGERSVELSVPPVKGLLVEYWVAVALVSTKTGAQSTATIVPAKILTTGPFEVVVHHLPENGHIDVAHPPTMKVYARRATVDYDQFDARGYDLVKTIPGVKAGVFYGCDAGNPEKVGQRPPGIMNVEGARRVNSQAGAASTTACGIYFDNVDGCEVEEVEIRNFAMGGIYLGSQAGGEVWNGRFREVDLHGMPWFAILLVHRVKDLEFTDCMVWDCGYGVDVEDTTWVKGLTFRRGGILECLGKSFQVLPPTGLGQRVEDLRLLGVAFIGNPTHIVFENDGQTYFEPGYVNGVLIDEDPETGRRPLFAYGKEGVMSVNGRVVDGVLRRAVIRRNGFPKTAYNRNLPVQMQRFFKPQGPYHDASARPAAGINRAIVRFKALVLGEHPDVAPPPHRQRRPLADFKHYPGTGPEDWTIEENDFEPVRYEAVDPSADWGTVWIDRWLGTYRFRNNVCGRSQPYGYRGTFVAVQGRPGERGAEPEFAGNTGPVGEFEAFFLDAGKPMGPPHRTFP